jgi:hypothetical protein
LSTTGVVRRALRRRFDDLLPGPHARLAEVVPGKSERSQDDGDTGHALVARSSTLQTHAFGREFEHPRQHHDDRKAEQKHEE